MSDPGTVVLAAAVWLGALLALPVPRPLGALVVAIAFALRRPSLLVVGGGLLASALGAAALAGLLPAPAGSVRGEVILLTDPVAAGHAVHVDVRVGGGRRVEAWARGDAAAALRDRLAGDVVALEGRFRPPATARDRLAVRHVAGRLEVHRVGRWRSGALATSAANGVRRLLQRGASSLDGEQRALFNGFLLGDDREIPAPVEADFRASGLTHLLAVSGQNLAFVLAVAGPAVRRLGLRARLVVSISVIAFFAVITRAEPSVLRASAMASIACWSAFAGRPIARVRVLALAVAALVLVDPMLTRSVGFQLSVGASLGLALLAAPLAARLRGPAWLAESLAVTLAAQAGVAPVLLASFGGMPLVTPLANLLAVPVAGPLTGWGMAAGLLAGLVGGPLATVLHLPTTLMLSWIQLVAVAAARAPLGLVDGRAVLIGAIAAVVVVRFRRFAAIVAIAVLVFVARPDHGPVAGKEVARGARLWRAGGVVLVLDGQADASRVLDGLRSVGVRHVDLVVARRGTRDTGALLVALRARVQVRAIAAPAGNRIRDATTVDEPLDVRVGRLTVRLRPRGGGLDVSI
jgi:competence protein ComEC